VCNLAATNKLSTKSGKATGIRSPTHRQRTLFPETRSPLLSCDRNVVGNLDKHSSALDSGFRGVHAPMRNEGAGCGYGYEMEGIVGTHPAGAEDGVQPSVRSSRLALHHPRPSESR
jgi:hypothetical protein